ncbi:MAG: hypothetical protein QXW00_00640 [Candidatus Woesearchaeota archaeon]
MEYIFSSCIGSFALDKNLKTLKFLGSDNPVENHLKILGGMLTKEDEALLKEYPEAKVLRTIGSEDGKIVKASPEILRSILLELSSQNYLRMLRDANLRICGKSLSESVSPDILIIQQADAISELSKTANLLSRRLREWYELYNPEVSRRIQDHERFVEMVCSSKKEELLKEMGIEKEQSIGSDLNERQLSSLMSLAEHVKNIFREIKKQESLLEAEMRENYPKLYEAVGPSIGAKLIALAGGIRNLAEMPSSKIQVLGAEKALFRHLKTGSRPPKYGVICQHQSVMNASERDKGKAARKLAAKASIAAKIDYFRKVQNAD